MTYHAVSKQEQFLRVVCVQLASQEEFQIFKLAFQICYAFCIGLLCSSAPASLIKSESSDASVCKRTKEVVISFDLEVVQMCDFGRSDYRPLLFKCPVFQSQNRCR